MSLLTVKFKEKQGEFGVCFEIAKRGVAFKAMEIAGPLIWLAPIDMAPAPKV